MNKTWTTLVLSLLIGLLLVTPSTLLAKEHGGTEAKEHGGAVMEGSHQPGERHAAIIREAAAILKTTHPDLAAKLEAIAAEEE